MVTADVTSYPSTWRQGGPVPQRRASADKIDRWNQEQAILPITYASLDRVCVSSVEAVEDPTRSEFEQEAPRRNTEQITPKMSCHNPDICSRNRPGCAFIG